MSISGDFFDLKTLGCTGVKLSEAVTPATKRVLAVGWLDVAQTTTSWGFRSEQAQRCLRDALYLGGAACLAYFGTSIVLHNYNVSWADVYEALRSGMVQAFTGVYNGGLREDFRTKFKVTAPQVEAGHSHGNAAADRARADQAIRAFVSLSGGIQYPVSSSGRDQMRGIHYIMSPRDFGFKVSYKQITDKHFITMTDVDYYVDVPHMIGHGRPIIMYTCTPSSAAKTSKEYSYTFIGNELHMKVTGGGMYKHELWDYDSDYVTVDKGWSTWVCTVEKRATDEDHAVVLITPEYRVMWPFNKMLKPMPELKRLRVQHGPATVLKQVRTNAKGETSSYVTFARQGHYYSAQVEEGEWDNLAYRYRKSTKPSPGDIERLLMTKYEDRPKLASLICEILEWEGELPSGLPSFKPEPAAHYQALGPLKMEDAKPGGVQIAPPLTDNPAIIAGISYNNEVAGAQGRVEWVCNTKIPPSNFIKYAQDFAAAVVPVPGVGVPDTMEDVWLHQTLPAQRGRLDRVWNWTHSQATLTVRPFIKREAYANPNDPRIISQVSSSHQALLSQYTHSMKRHLRNFNWYGPGKNPEQISDRIVDIARRGPVIETDYTRFDGHVSEWIRTYVEQAIYLRWVSSVYETELRTILKAEVNAKCITTHGYSYKVDGQRLSGSPLTTDGNTLINAFIAYCGLRLSGKPHMHAFNQLGIYMGDDGVSVGNPEDLLKASQLLGFEVKLEVKDRVPLRFVGRIYDNAFGGDRASIQDPVRTIKKLHISTSVIAQRLPLQALVNKAFGYLLLDDNSPIVSDWCRAILGLYPQMVAWLDSAELPYHAWNHENNEVQSWPQMPRDRALNLVAAELKRDVPWVEELCDTINNATVIEQLTCLVPTDDGDIKLSCVRTDKSVVCLKPAATQTHEPNPREPTDEDPVPTTSAQPIASTSGTNSSTGMGDTRRSPTPTRSGPRQGGKKGKK